MKRVIFSRHALLRMADTRRGPITKDEVRQVLSNPDVTYPGVDRKRNALGEAGGKSLRICYIEEADRIVVITVINRRVP